MLVAEVYMFSPMLDIEKVGSMLVRSWMLDSRLPEGSKLELINLEGSKLVCFMLLDSRVVWIMLLGSRLVGFELVVSKFMLDAFKEADMVLFGLELLRHFQATYKANFWYAT